MDLSKFSRDIFHFLAYRVSYEKSKGFQVKTITVPPDKSLSHRALIFASLAEGVSEIRNVLMSEDVQATIRILRQLGVRIEIVTFDFSSSGSCPGSSFPSSENALSPDSSQTKSMFHLSSVGLPGPAREFSCGRKRLHPVTRCQMPFFQDARVYGVGLRGYKPTDAILDCGNSGTTMRLMLGALAGQGIAAKLTGDASLNRRPIDRVIEPLQNMGAHIDVIFENGRRVILLSPHPGLQPLNYKLPVASAQVKTALLLAGLTAGVAVTLEELQPSRNHTEILLRRQGMVIVTAAEKYHPLGSCPGSVFSVGERQNNTITGHPTGPGIFLQPPNFIIPGDFSSAAFFIVWALLQNRGARRAVPLQIINVGLNPTRTGLLDVLRRMGAQIEVLNRTPTGDGFQEFYGDLLIKPSSLKNTTVAPHEIPFLIDEIPILALAASFAEGEFVLSGAEELRVKECDRIHAICTELKKLGVDITEKKDGFVIRRASLSPCGRGLGRGGSVVKDINFSSYGDHRIAMMLVIAGKILGHDLTIDDTDCIETSFPGFLEYF